MEEVLLIVIQIPNPSSHYLPSRSLLIRGNIRERLAVDRSIVNVRTSRLARPKIYRLSLIHISEPTRLLRRGGWEVGE